MLLKSSEGKLVRRFAHAIVRAGDECVVPILDRDGEVLRDFNENPVLQVMRNADLDPCVVSRLDESKVCLGRAGLYHHLLNIRLC